MKTNGITASAQTEKALAFSPFGSRIDLAASE
jgi:hypothetical protein